MEEFKDSVRKGFLACKTDIDSLQTENNSLKKQIETMQNDILELTTEIKGLKIALDYIKDFKENNQPLPEQIQIETPMPQSQSSPIPQKTQDPYEALLAFKAKTNKREVLKQKLLSMIGENGMNLSELKFMFVEHFRYCSKATFYNYLKELELEKTIKIERENGKNNIYLTSISKQI